MIKDKEKFINIAGTFFEKLFGTALKNNYGEIHLTNFKGVDPRQCFFNDSKKAAEFAYQMCNTGIDIYFGVNPRVGRAGKEENIQYLTAFHAEIDYGQKGHKKPSQYKDYDEASQAVINFHLPPTLVNTSGGGLHCYWVLNNPVKVSDVGIDDLKAINKNLLIALKGDIGTQNINRVLRPPGTYNFKPEYDTPLLVNVFIKDGPLYDFKDFKEYIAIAESEKVPKNNISAQTVLLSIDKYVEDLTVSSKIKALITNGNNDLYPSRSEADMAVVTALIHKGFEKSQISAIFNKYPIGEKYREQKSPEKYMQHTIENAKKHSNLTEEELQNPLFISGTITKDDKGIFGFNVVKFEEYIVKKYKLQYFEKEKAFFQYNGRCYEQISDDQLNFLCQSELQDFRAFFNKAAMANFIHYCVGGCLIKGTKAYDHQKRFLTLQNGLYDLNGEKLIPHDSKYFTTNLLPYEYDPDAQSPLWERYLNDVFLNDKDILTFVQQAVGYSFLKDIPTAALFLLIGEGSNGKSVFVNTTQNLFGEENVSNVNLHQLSNEYYTLELFGKMVNLSSESSHKKKIDTELIKAAVAGDWISGRIPYKPPTKFRPYAKHFLSLNKVPKSDDLTHGWERRIYPIEFNRKFTKKDADVHMTKKLKAELSGIFNWALEGYKNLRKSDYVFAESASIDRAKENYKNQSNSVYEFISTTLSKASENDVAFFGDVYKKYKYHCACEGDKDILTKSEFKKVLQSSGYTVDNSKKHANAVCVFGVTCH